MLYTLSHNLALFEEKSYLITRYVLVREVRITQVFFLTFLIVWKAGISHNHNADL